MIPRKRSNLALATDLRNPSEIVQVDTPILVARGIEYRLQKEQSLSEAVAILLEKFARRKEAEVIKQLIV